MKNLTIKISLFLNYFIFAILLNSVGIVILKSLENYKVDEVQASALEWFKDLPIALVSFIIASFLPRIGYKKAILTGLLISMIACVIMYYGNSFWSAKFLFAAIGASFALIKVSVYSVIGLVTNSAKEHNSLMSSIEGVFMIGIALAYFLFPAFNDANDPDAWLRVYWLLSGLALISFLFLYVTKFDEGEEIPGINLKDDVRQMIMLCVKLSVIVFVCSAFLFVMVEQGIMTWLPTFYNRVLELPSNVSIMMSSIFALSLAAGRIGAGVLSKYISWFYILISCILIAMLMVIFILPKTIDVETGVIESIFDIPILGFAFPMIGIFIAPIYPLLNSAVLSSLPKKMHSPMTGLIVIFSALGGTTGSTLIGWLFKNTGAQKAFYYTLIPMVLLSISLWVLKRITTTHAN
ncbi:MFS transporter [Aquimarina sp. 2201CG14-23]|uniref:MFS transporter n=1 Tax=Aquimarina mycalae TaxID=3040073 RepID=UPI0024782667|nr:MFS transporter [Aquimarina sp. 2201CG14-23]MDH7445373.1 MFS transporter [Aquimarina sp. 2201CG14-23]